MWRSCVRGGFPKLPVAAVWLWLVGMCLTTAAQATSPPDMPLPPCVEVNGVKQGACPNEFSDLVTGTTRTKFVAGQPLILTTVPAIPQCTRWNQPTNAWTPSTCYNGFGTPVLGGCAFIDLQDGNRFKRLPCPLALYKQSSATTSEQLFTKQRVVDGNSSCGLRSFFWGDSEVNRQGGNSWMQANPSWLDCEIALKGARPDGLYGPTWVSIYVSIDIVTSGCCNADPRYPQHIDTEIFIPIDGDLRFGVDVGVDATASIRDADWDNGRVTATYRATLQNRGGEVARNVELTMGLPSQLHYESVSDASCTAPANNRGGTVACKGFDMAAGSSRVFDVLVRVVNATDLDGLQTGFVEGSARGVQFRVKADGDGVAANNEAVAKLDIPFRRGSYDQTKAAMQTLVPYFDYMAPNRFSQCNVYKDDIFARLEAIRVAHPQVFANLSYGGVTSGEYDVAGGLYRSKGHVGVVVYTRGTNFRQTGIIINGTPSNSPLSEVSVVGPGDTLGISFNGATSLDKRYLRTPADKFPGFPQEESGGSTGDYGFEGRYADNRDQFGAAAVRALAESTEAMCPFVPNAVVVTTESPVDIVVTNSKGQRVETQDGKLVAQQLDGRIQTMAFAHGDGTFGWTLVLPVDDYDVKLRGTRSGSYRLTLTTYAADGTPKNMVTSGNTTPGKVDAYQIDVPDPAPSTPTPPTTPTTPTGGASGGGGGGAIDGLLLASLLSLLTLQLWRKRKGLPARSRRHWSRMC